MVSTPEPVPSAAEKVTVTAFGYAVARQGLPLQRTVTVGGVGSGTSVNDAAGDVRPAPFVAVTVRVAGAALGAAEKVNVRLEPEPSTVNPAGLGKVYDAIPDSPSAEAAVTV